MTAHLRKFCFFMLIVFMLNLNVVWAQNSDAIVLDVAWSPTGDMIAMIDDGGMLNVTLSDQVTPVFQFAVTVPTLFDATVAWNPDGSLLAVGIGYQVYILETTTWQLLHQFVGGDSDGYTILLGRFEETPEGIVSINWSSDSRYVVSGSLSYLTTVWDNHSEQVIYQAPDGSGGGPGRVWLEDEGWLGDGATRHNAFTGERVRVTDAERPYRFGAGGGVNATAVHPNDRHIAWGTELGFLLIYDLYTLRGVQGLEVTQSEPPEPRRALTEVVWNGDGNFLAAASRDGELYVIDLAASEVTTVLNVVGRITALDWNPQTNETLYAGVTESGQLILAIVDVSNIVDGPSDTPTPTFTPTPTATLDLSAVWAQTSDAIILDVAWSPNGDLIAMIDDGGTLNVTLSDQITPVFQFARPVMLHEAAAVWSPQGDRLAVGIGNRMYIWDVVTWQLLHDYEVGLPSGFFTWGPTDNIPEGVQTITWSTDGRYVVVGTYSYETSVWDTQESQLIFREGDLSGGGPGRVWLEDKGWLGDGATRLNAFTGEVVVVPTSENHYGFGAGGGVNATAVRPNRRHIAWGTELGFLLIYDLYTLRGVQALEVTQSEPPEPRRALTEVVWNGDGNFLAAASRDGELYVVDLMADEVTSLLKLEGRITALDWNPQTNEIVYAGVSESGQSILTIVDVSNIVDGSSTFTPTPTATLNLNAAWAQTSDAIVLDVAWSPNGDMIAMIDDGGTLNVTLSDQSTPVFQFAVTVPTLFDATVAWNPDGSLLAVGIGYQVYILETTTWQLLHQFVGGDSDGYTVLLGRFEETPEGIVSINWSNDSRYIVSGSLGYLTTVWDNQSEQVIYQAPDGSGGGPGRVWLEGEGWLGDGATRLNAFTGEVVVIDRSEIQNRFGAGGGTNATDVHPNHRHIAWGTEFGFLVIYDLYTLRGVQALEVTQSEPPEPRRALTEVVWNGDGNFLSAASRDGELYVIDLAANEVMTVLNVDGRITAVDWNPQTNEILYAGVSESGQPSLSIVDVSDIVDCTYVMPPTDPSTPMLPYTCNTD